MPSATSAATLRREVRTFLQEQLPDGVRGPDSFEEGMEREEAMRAWRRRVAAKGWVAPHWPTQYGGAECTERLVTFTQTAAALPQRGLSNIA